MPQTRSVSRFVRWSVASALTAAVISSVLGASSASAQDKKRAGDGENGKRAPGYYGPQPTTEAIDLTMYERIRTEAFQHGQAMQLSEALEDGIGPRLTGSPNMAKANAWTRDTLTAIGLSNAHLEDWGEFGMGWQQINTWARMVSPDPEPLWLQAAPWSPATKGPVTGGAVYVPLNDAADLDKLKGTLSGKIVLLGAMRPTPDITEPLFHRYTDAELKELEKVEDSAAIRRFLNGQTREQYLAARRKGAELKAQAVKMMVAEGVAAIITPSRDSQDGGGTGIISTTTERTSQPPPRSRRTR